MRHGRGIMSMRMGMRIMKISKRNGIVRFIYEGTKKNRIFRHCFFVVDASRKKAIANKAAKALGKYSACVDESLDLKAVTQDMISMYRRYGYGFDEYLLYYFYEKSLAERLKFVADWERMRYTDAFNKPRNAMIFDNKMETYRTFKPYFKRQVLLCRRGG